MTRNIFLGGGRHWERERIVIFLHCIAQPSICTTKNVPCAAMKLSLSKILEKKRVCTARSKKNEQCGQQNGKENDRYMLRCNDG